MLKRLMAGVLLATLAVTAIAPAASANHTSGKNVVERAVQLNRYTRAFDTLLAAATCNYFGSAVTDALQQPGTTLFAPTDRAFHKLGLNKKNICATYQNDQAALLDVLTYHVYDGKVTYRDARKAIGTSLTMLNGEQAAITGRWWRVKIDGARITVPNVRASNGLIHVVNDVLLP